MQGSTLRRTAGGLAAATLMAWPAAAAARPIPGDPPQVRSAALLGQLQEPQAPVTRAGSSSSGFHWDDAAIGAVGTLALAAAGVAASGATRRRRTGGPALS